MQTYLVGGAVRDKLLGFPFHECDWVVVGSTAQQLLDLGYQQVGKDFPVFLHPESKEEYALARTERKSGAGYTGFDCYAAPDVTLEEDLLRRDLTINAIAETSDGEIIDPYHGQQDLKNKLLRHVSPAFSEDPLRVLRVARFIARYAHLGFTIAEETLALARQISHSGELQTLPTERLWQEIEKALQTKSPQCFFQAMDAMNASQVLFPELVNLTPSSIHHLQQAATAQYPSIICFAILFANIEVQHIETFCQRIKCPGDYRDLAMVVSNYAGDYYTNQFHANKPPSAESTLTLLESLDAIRRTERFEQFLACCKILYASLNISDTLMESLLACKKVNAKALVDQGIKGKAIASALRLKRIDAINTLNN